MRKFTLILSLILCLGIIDSVQAANSGQSYMQQAQSCLSRKEYTQARYLFLQAYNAYIKEGNTASAINVACKRLHFIIVKTTIKKPSTCAPAWNRK